MMGRGRTQQITNQTGTIVSHREYSHENYPNRVDSTLEIEINGILLITVSIKDFELYLRRSCYDFLQINGSKYCGKELSHKSRTFISRNGKLSLKFHTSSNNRDKGFVLDYHYFSEFKSHNWYHL